MEMMALISALRRWRWLAAALVVVAGTAATLRVVTSKPAYQARVMVQVTAPRDVDVSVLDTSASSTSTLRDDLTLVENDFSTIVDASTVRQRTIQQLGLSRRDAGYAVAISTVGDSHFMLVVVSSPNAALVQKIADTQVAQAIRYLGELLAKPANDTKQLLAAQLDAARAQLPTTAPPSTDPVAVAQAQDAQTTYQTLLDRYTQASLVADNAARASFIQPTAPAASLARPTLLHRLITQAGLAVAGGLALAIVLVMVLDATVNPRMPAIRPASATRRVRAACATPAKRLVGARAFRTKERTNGVHAAVMAHASEEPADDE